MKNLGLHSKGFITVATPLLIEFIMMGWIIVLIFHSQVDLQTVSTHRAVTSDLHRLIWETVDGLFQMHSHSDTMGLIDYETTKKYRARFERSLNAVFSHKWSAEQQPRVEDLRKTTTGLLNCLDRVQVEMNQGRAHWTKVDNQYFDEIRSHNLAFVEAASAILVVEERQLLSEQTILLNSSKSIEKALTIAIPVGLLISIFFVWFYSVGILKPLNRTMKNGMLLSRRQPLMTALQGNDELSRLDRLIHSVSDAVDESFSREQRMFENTTDLICSIEKDLSFAKSNRAVERMFGITQDDVLRLPISDFVIPSDIENVHKELQKASSANENHTFEVRMQPIDRGTVLDTRWSVFWSQTQQQYFCVIHDISEEKNIARMKQDFLEMISQDLLSPLSAMQSSITAVAEGKRGPVSDRMKKDMATAQSNIHALENFVSDLLDYQQLRSLLVELTITEFDLKEICHKAFQLVKASAKAKKIEVQLPKTDATVSGDERMLMRTVLNLLSNAIKFSPAGGVVSVEIQQDLQSTILSVTDSGPGITEADKAKIFEAFEQATEPHTKGGTGLGLAIAKLAVEQHGGNIGVRGSTRGEGSTFWLSLPRSGPPNRQ